MSRVGSWLLTFLLLGIFIAAAGFALRERLRSGRGMPAYSVYTDRGDGLGEAAYLLGKLGWTPVAMTRATPLPGQRGLLVIAEPAEDSLSENDAKLLMRWVEEGNMLVLASRLPTGLHTLLGVSLVSDTDEDRDTGHSVSLVRNDGLGDDYTDGIGRLTVGTRSTVGEPSGATVLWRVGKAPGAVLLERGKGRVIVLADATPLSGRGLRRDDNLLFLVNVARWHAENGTVMFDEYHHGFRSADGFWGYLGQHGQRLALLPPLLVVAIALWRGAVRLGPPVPRPVTSQADAVDYASALGRLYRRTGALREPARALLRDFLAALTKHLRLRRSAIPAEILAAWRQQHPGNSGERLQRLLRGLAELRKGGLSERQLLSWHQAFDRFRDEFLLTAAGKRATDERR
jgi:hypothetical protein